MDGLRYLGCFLDIKVGCLLAWVYMVSTKQKRKIIYAIGYWLQRSSIIVVSDFKAVTCPPPPKFIKCTELDFTTPPAIALIQCYAIVLFFRPYVGSYTIFDKL